MAIVLFVCTAMIYASLRFLQGGTPADGGQLHAVLAWHPVLRWLPHFCTLGPVWIWWCSGDLAVIFTALVANHAAFSMYRNKRIKHKSTLRSVIGVRHTKILRQKPWASAAALQHA